MRSKGSASPPVGALVHHTPWQINRRVIGALFLREMLTRYGRNNIGFLWLLVEPMIFTLVVVGIRSAAGSFYQGSIPMVAFAVTGWPPLMMWRNMPVRCIGALKSNRSLLHHRQVKIIDVYASRLLLEFMATSASFVLVSLILSAIGWLSAPEDVLKVVAGWLLLAWFGMGLALTVGSLSERSELVAHFWRPASYLLMPLSGVAFVVDALPQGLQGIALWFPMLNAVEFLRDGWFGSDFHAHYDVAYVIAFNLCLTFAGIALVRQVGLDSDEE
jgi:ABC-2 type transport system permease protein/capsular polysaccharide transport system permease protein